MGWVILAVSVLLTFFLFTFSFDEDVGKGPEIEGDDWKYFCHTSPRGSIEKWKKGPMTIECSSGWWGPLHYSLSKDASHNGYSWSKSFIGNYPSLLEAKRKADYYINPLEEK